MNATTYLLLAFGLAVVLVVVRRSRHRRPSWVVEELDRKAQLPHITRPSPYTVLERLVSCLRCRRQRQRDAAMGKYKIPPFLRSEVGHPDLQAYQNEPLAAQSVAAVPCLPR